MLKKLSAILVLIAMTAALAACGNDKDSTSKNESSENEAVTEEVTVEETEAITEALTDPKPTAAESESSDSADTAEVEESILGKWKSEYVLDSQGNAATVAQYSELLG